MEVGSGAGVGGCDRGDWDGDEAVWEVELGVTNVRILRDTTPDMAEYPAF